MPDRRRKAGHPSRLVVNTDSDLPHVHIFFLLLIQLILALFSLYPPLFLRPLLSFIIIRHYYHKSRKVQALMGRLVFISLCGELLASFMLLFTKQQGIQRASNILVLISYSLRALGYSIVKLTFKHSKLTAWMIKICMMLPVVPACYWYATQSQTISWYNFKSAMSLAFFVCWCMLLARYNSFIGINFWNVVVGELMMVGGRGLEIHGLEELLWGVGLYLVSISIYIQELKDRQLIQHFKR